jgi:hypothetical protein
MRNAFIARRKANAINTSVKVLEGMVRKAQLPGLTGKAL